MNNRFGWTGTMPITRPGSRGRPGVARFFCGLRRVRAMGALAVLALILSACSPPATLKQRPGYWADQSVHATAYNQRVRFLVIHYTGGDDARSLQTLTGPHVSVQYLVPLAISDRSGEPIVRQLVPENERAWHAGVSAWAGRHEINDSSIGIEIVNRGPIQTPTGQAWQPFSQAQINAVIALARDIVHRYGIFPKNVVGHSDIAPGRKIDPGPAFPWLALYNAGIGAWPDASRVAAYRQTFAQQMPDVLSMQRAFATYGYDLPATGVLDAQTRKVVTAFQMHFRPTLYNGEPDAETLARLWALNDKYNRD